MENLIPISAILLPFLIVAVVMYFGHRNRAAVLETVRTAVQSGQTLDPATIRALGVERKKKGGDIRWGIVLVAVALACMSFGWALTGVDTGDVDILMIFSGIAAFPGFVGIALILMGVFMRDKAQDDAA